MKIPILSSVIAFILSYVLLTQLSNGGSLFPLIPDTLKFVPGTRSILEYACLLSLILISNNLLFDEFCFSMRKSESLIKYFFCYVQISVILCFLEGECITFTTGVGTPVIGSLTFDHLYHGMYCGINLIVWSYFASLTDEIDPISRGIQSFFVRRSLDRETDSVQELLEEEMEEHLVEQMGEESQESWRNKLHPVTQTAKETEKETDHKKENEVLKTRAEILLERMKEMEVDS